MKIKLSPADSARMISALGPAREILDTIHFDHLYSTPSSIRQSEHVQSLGSTDDSRLSCSRDIDTAGINCGARWLKCDADPDMDSLNADSIQQVFQKMINMTSLTPIADAGSDSGDSSVDGDGDTSWFDETDEPERNTPVTKGNKLHSIKLVRSLSNTPQSHLLRGGTLKSDENEVTSVTPKEKHNNITRSFERKLKSKKREENKTSRVDKNESPGTNAATPTKVCEDEYKAVAKCLERERQLNTLLKFTAELLVLRWKDYLAMSLEEIRKFEVKNAREIGAVEEVVEMLEDKDRYVWELVDGLQFF